MVWVCVLMFTDLQVLSESCLLYFPRRAAMTTVQQMISMPLSSMQNLTLIWVLVWKRYVNNRWHMKPCFSVTTSEFLNPSCSLRLKVTSCLSFQSILCLVVLWQWVWYNMPQTTAYTYWEETVLASWFWSPYYIWYNFLWKLCMVKCFSNYLVNDYILFSLNIIRKLYNYHCIVKPL